MDIAVNDIVEYEKILYKVVDKAVSTPGRRMPITQLVLCPVAGGKKLEMRSDKLSKVELESKDLKSTGYDISATCEFLDMESHEVMRIDKGKIDKPEFLQNGMDVRVFFTQQHGIIKVELPRMIEATVVYAGEAARGKNKTVNLDIFTEKHPEGLTIQAPCYIKRGDIVVFEKDTLEFKRRK